MTPAAELARGWRVLAAAALGVGVGLGGLPFFTLGVFLKPLAEAFAWTRAEVAATSLCLSIGSGLTAPVIGRLADRLDVRRIALVSLAALSLAYLALTRLDGDVRLLYAGMIGLALCGCGTSPLVWALSVSTWFDRARGLALGLTLAGSGVAAIVAPRLIAAVIERHGWQGGYVALALVTGLMALPVVWLLFPGKRPPEPADATPSDAAGLSLGAALRSPRFWQLSAGILLVNGAIGAILVHLVPLLTDAGMTPPAAATIAGTLGFAVVAGRLSIGWLVDRCHAPHVAGIVLALPVVGFALLSLPAPSGALVVLAALTFGFASGAEVDLLAFLAGRLFGLRAFGTIYGLLIVAFLIGGGVGPILLGHLQDRTGDYGAGLLVAGAACLAGALALATLGRFPAPPNAAVATPRDSRPPAG